MNWHFPTLLATTCCCCCNLPPLISLHTTVITQSFSIAYAMWGRKGERDNGRIDWARIRRKEEELVRGFQYSTENIQAPSYWSTSFALCSMQHVLHAAVIHMQKMQYRNWHHLKLFQNFDSHEPIIKQGPPSHQIPLLDRPYVPNTQVVNSIAKFSV